MRCLPFTMLAIPIVACGTPDPDLTDARRRVNEPKLLLTLADGGAARDVRQLGIVGGLAPYLDAQSVLLWPTNRPIVGDAAIGTALEALDGSRVFWQPLAIHAGRSLGITVGVLTIDDSLSGAADSPRIGRYLAAWRATQAGWRLAVFFVGGLSVPSLPSSTAGGGSDSAMVPGAIAEIDRQFRDELREHGPAQAFGNHIAETGVTFSSSGELNIGPGMVREALAQVPEGAVWTMRPEYAGISDDGALGWTTGELTIADTTVGESRRSSWNYMLLWRREGMEEYRLVAAATNLRPSGSVADSAQGRP